VRWILPYDGTDWFYDDSRRPTVYEAQLMMQVSDDLQQALAAENPNAWLAALVVARKRAGLPVDRARKVNADLLEMEDCVNATLAEAQRAKDEGADGAEKASKPAARARGRKPAAVPAQGDSAAEDPSAA
jgi:hypothetical protein